MLCCVWVGVLWVGGCCMGGCIVLCVGVGECMLKLINTDTLFVAVSL